jgi:hypothetical protein
MTKPKNIRVYPSNDEVRKHVIHPTGGGFQEGRQSAEWPRDQFTLRRIRDGDVTTDDEKPEEGEQQQ